MQADVDYFKSLNIRYLAKELETSRSSYLRALAEHLGIDTRYDKHCRKPKNVLAAAIYEHIRQERAEQVAAK